MWIIILNIMYELSIDYIKSRNIGDISRKNTDFMIKF